MKFRILIVFAWAAVTAFSEPSFEAAGKAASSPEYFAEFYSYQGAILNTAAQSHSFARFFKMENGLMTEVVDISWLPEPGSFRRRNRVPLLRTVAGHNYTLGETLALAGGKPIFSNGQFPISPALFEASKRRKAELESGRISYQLLGDNCIAAISGVLGHLPTGLSRGVGATNKLVDFFTASGQMGPQWKRGAAPVTPPTEAPPQPSGYRVVESPPSPAAAATHSSETVVVSSPQPAQVVQERRPVLFPRLRRR